MFPNFKMKEKKCEENKYIIFTLTITEIKCEENKYIIFNFDQLLYFFSKFFKYNIKLFKIKSFYNISFHYINETSGPSGILQNK